MKIIEVKNLSVMYEDQLIHDNISLNVSQNEIYGLLGPSGCGKTTLMRAMISLQNFVSGEITVLGNPLSNISYMDLQNMKQKWGVLFQFGALFSSLSVAENIALPLIEYTDLSSKLIDDIVKFKIHLVGLKQSDAGLYPSQISGGMKKKAALARCLAMDPKLLFLDEPTSGLDPISAREFDKLILKLRELLGLTIVMVSHDLHSIYDTLDRMAIIDNKKIIFEGSLDEVNNVQNSFIDSFFKEKISYE